MYIICVYMLIPHQTTPCMFYQLFIDTRRLCVLGEGGYMKRSNGLFTNPHPRPQPPQPHEHGHKCHTPSCIFSHDQLALKNWTLTLTHTHTHTRVSASNDFCMNSTRLDGKQNNCYCYIRHTISHRMCTYRCEHVFQFETRDAAAICSPLHVVNWNCDGLCAHSTIVQPTYKTTVQMCIRQ